MNLYKHCIVITGGIGSGKSTVSNLLKLYGYTIIEADNISSDIIKQRAVIDKIVDTFGAEYQKDDGEIDKKKLGDLVFDDAISKLLLEEILHPLIRQEIEKKSLELESKNAIYFIDIPLFYETKHYNIKNVLLVYADKDTQIERIIKRDNISKLEATKKVESQIPNEEKKKLATYVIDNSKDLKHLQKEIERFLKEVVWFKNRPNIL